MKKAGAGDGGGRVLGTHVEVCRHKIKVACEMAARFWKKEGRKLEGGTLHETTGCAWLTALAPSHLPF